MTDSFNFLLVQNYFLVLKVISKFEDFAIFIIDANLTDVSAA